MSENTKNTLVEAENVALRVELDEANKKIKAIESGNRQDAEQRKIIAALTKNAALDKRRIADLAAKQLTAEQINTLRGYDRLSAFSSEQSGKLSALTGKHDRLTERLKNAGYEIKDKGEIIERLARSSTEAKNNQKKHRRWLLTGVVASVIFAGVIGGGSYYYVETQLTPAEGLSPEAREAFKKHAPEYYRIITNETAQERERLRIASDALTTEKMNFDRSKPGWFDSFGIPLIVGVVALLFGFFMGATSILALFH